MSLRSSGVQVKGSANVTAKTCIHAGHVTTPRELTAKNVGTLNFKTQSRRYRYSIRKNNSEALFWSLMSGSSSEALSAEGMSAVVQQARAAKNSAAALLYKTEYESSLRVLNESIDNFRGFHDPDCERELSEMLVLRAALLTCSDKHEFEAAEEDVKV